ncbi:helix-turn-helix transcriptional regulator [Sedimenticola sp.]|uniref:helix-turn-helix transcriptional regulator n=1 Tax=Sedimenticola sp. TaxID=1940285 RepID=UPI003D0C3B80
MRRADRLFQLVQLLRHDRVVTARHLAQELEVSERTIYRDIQDLSLSGVPILGEAGVGYRLLKGFTLPPLMFSEDELAALLTGMRMVQAWTDRDMARAAQGVINKVESAVPEPLRPELARSEILVPDFNIGPIMAHHLSALRRACRELHKVRLSYVRADGETSERVIHPLGLFYWGKVWTLVAWCELRSDFRHFRLDRIQSLLVTDRCFELQVGHTLNDYLAQVTSC